MKIVKVLLFSLILLQFTLGYSAEKLDLPRFVKSVQHTELRLRKTLEKASAELDKIAKRPAHEMTFENTVRRLDEISYVVTGFWYEVGLIAEVTKDMALKKAAQKASLEIGDWYIGVNAREDIYQAVKTYAATQPQLKDEDKRLLESILRDFERQGFNLPKQTQEEIKVLKKELNELEQKVSDNISLANKVMTTFTPEEAQGIPADILANLDQDAHGNYVASMGIAGQYLIFNKFSPLESTRKKAFVARQTRAKDSNKTLIEGFVRKRAQLAQLLGYNTWADYRTETKMAGSGARAYEFIKGLSDGLQPKFEAEVESFRKIKAKDTNNKDAVLNAWDFRYFMQKYAKEKYNVDLNALKKYFEYEQTLQGMFRLYEDLMELEIKEIQAPYVWDEKVRLIEISDSRSGKLLGHLYLDMFPRPETQKYGHFAQFTLRDGKVLRSGKERRPVAALVCNFPEPKNGNPSLLSLDNVETLFHEFGHALHTILSETTYAYFAGTNVPRDFVEAPSQMLEYFLSDKAVLDRFAYNYQDPSDKISQELLDKIQAAQLATIGTTYRRQFAFGLMDLKLHMEIGPNQEFDIAEFTNNVLKDVFLEFPQGTTQITSFGHLWGGYDAGYYGYAWADNLSADMASVFEQAPGKFLNKEVAMRLRDEVYAKGNSRDVNDSVEAFLGRKPSIEAFLKKLGIGL